MIARLLKKNAVCPRHVVHVVQHLKPGGIETLVLELLSRTRADRVSVISLEGRAAETIAKWPRLSRASEHLYFLNKEPGMRPQLALELARMLRTMGCDVVHTHHVGPLLYGGIAARLSGCRLVHTEHDAWHLEDKRRRSLQSLLVKVVRPTVVADALFVAQAYRAALQRDPAKVVLNGIDCRHFHPGDKRSARAELGLPQLGTLIGCAARLEKVKGVDQMISALPFLPDYFGLAVAGDGSQGHSLRQLARALGVESRVSFLGRVDDMRTFYQALDLFCLPSRKEGMPLSPLEAQACGVPAVAFDVGGTSEAICPETGFLVEAGNVNGLAEALEAAVRQPAGVSPRNFVLRDGNLDQTAEAYNALYAA
ncbi:MAG: glycosyltransferase [Magnetovibrionaceae bacterium]